MAVAYAIGILYGTFYAASCLAPTVRLMWRAWHRAYLQLERDGGLPWLPDAVGVSERALYMLALFTKVREWIGAYLAVKAAGGLFKDLGYGTRTEAPFEGFKIHVMGTGLSFGFALIAWKSTQLLLRLDKSSFWVAVILIGALPFCCTCLSCVARRGLPKDGAPQLCFTQRVVRHWPCLLILALLAVFYRLAFAAGDC